MKCRVSVIIEVYNEEHNALAEHSESIDALLEQNFPIDQIELLFIGSESQLEDVHIPSEWSRFGQLRLEPIPSNKTHYWEQKNFSAHVAGCEIVAWLDSDVTPHSGWLEAIVASIEGGADVSVGPSLYRSRNHNSLSPLMLAAGFTSWGFVLSSSSKPGNPMANSLLAHNLGIRRDLALKVPFRTAHHSFQSSLLYFDLVRNGADIVYQPMQRAAHSMTLKWWITRRHFRTGWETYEARKSDEMWPRLRDLEKFRWIEPIMLRGGLVLRDVVHWFRFRRVMGIGLLQAWAMVPLVLITSATARAAEMTGMYAALIAPKQTAYQARF